MVCLVILFCIWFSALVMMVVPPQLAVVPQQSLLADEPEPEDQLHEETSTSSRSFNTIAVYGFLALCVKRCLELLSDAEFEQNDSAVGQLNATYDVLIDTHVLFENDGITSANLRSMLDMHTALQQHDSLFDAFSLIAVGGAPTVGGGTPTENESRFEGSVEEPDCESMLPPDPPCDPLHQPPSEPYQPHSPEHMAMWLVDELSERISRSILKGRPKKVLQYVEQRQITKALCRYCDQHPDQRGAVWDMMQSLDFPESDEEEA